jgi:SAM-dependent methyltransferase
MRRIRRSTYSLTARLATTLAAARDFIARMLDTVPTPLLWRSWNARRVGRAFDVKYGTDTQTHVGVEALGIDRRLARHAVHYEPSTIPKIRRALRQLRIRHGDYSFIDVGSGKGIVSLLAAQYPFRRVIGIEISAVLHHTAEKNLALYRASCTLRAPVHFVNVNALDYDVTHENQVVYLYNPFDATFLKAFLDRLRPRTDSADVVVVYVNPVHKETLASVATREVLFEDGTLVIYRLRRSDQSI